MKILLTADQYYPPTLGGSAISVRRLAHGLAERGHHVTVVAPAENFSDYVEREGAVVVVRCRSVPAVHLIKHADRDKIRVALLPMLVVRRVINELEPDVVHVQFPPYIGLTALKLARKLGIPVLGTLHAVPDNPFPARNKRSPVYRLFASKFWETIVDWGTECDLVTAPTSTACELLATHGLSRSLPISNGVDLHTFRPPPDNAARRDNRARLHLPLDQPLVLYAGRFAPEKRLDLLLRAIPSVRQQMNAHFVLVGTGSQEVIELADELDVLRHVTFTGVLPEDELPLVYRAADVFALPSEAELQGMVLLEAAASGLPLVGADALAIPEIVRDGENGFLHRKGDYAHLADRLLVLLSDPALRRRFGARGREIAQSHSFERTVSRFEKLYEQVRHQATAAVGASFRRGA
jgi:glycosyltransferase involved in cell wall biosynthesis